MARVIVGSVPPTALFSTSKQASSSTWGETCFGFGCMLFTCALIAGFLFWVDTEARKEKVIDQISLGKITDAKIVDNAFNEHKRMQITCEKGVFVHYNHEFVPLGVECYMDKWASGRITYHWNQPAVQAEAQ